MTPETTRRGFLSIAVGVAGAMAGCRALRFAEDPLPENLAIPRGKASDGFRFLNRAAFGPRPGDLSKFAEIGMHAWVRNALSANEIESPTLIAKLHRIDALRMDGMELLDLPRDEIIRQIQQAAILRATYGKNQLLERMVDFWSNHFNIYARKTDGMYLIQTDADNVIRRNALGSFKDLLSASAKSPAMLHYLDNRVNRKGVPNENYARELLELHTMGVEGGYTQRDVQEVARCLTGWTVESRFLRPKGKFRFDESQHDDGEKEVLGHRIPAGGGIEDGERVIEIISKHPSTAKFISAKLCRYFLGEAAASWVEPISQTFIRTGGNIPAMLEQILLSEAMIESPPVVKRPFDFVVSTLRALDAETDGGKPIQAHLDAMGQPLYQWPMPDGYPDSTTSWTGSLLARWKFATALIGGRIEGSSVDLDRLKRHGAVWSELLIGSPSGWTFGGDRETAALLICSPEFQWR